MSIGFTIWFAVAGFVGTVWLVRVVAIHLALGKRQVLGSRSYDGPPDNPPRISVLVAAKDEEDNIEACVTTLLQQDYPNFEVIAIDDRSSDDTPAILSRLQGEADGKLRVVTVTALSDGWFGKNNAMHVGVADVFGREGMIRDDWLCFTDADCRQISTNTLSMAMREAVAHEVDFLSVTPVLETLTVWERIIQPVCAFVLIGWFLPERVNDPRKKTAYANGAFMLLRRSCYDAIGGHEGVRTKVNEDIHMARITKQMGMRLRVVENDDLYRTRMYRTARETWRGWSRIFYGCLETLPRLAAAASMVTVFTIVPWMSLVAALIGRVCHCSASSALSTGALPQSLLLTQQCHTAGEASTWSLLIVAWAGVILLKQIVTWRFYGIVKIGRLWSLAYVLGALVTLTMLINAMFKAAGAGVTTWRGTTYRGDQLVDSPTAAR
ncbi:MAG: glycosyltransferase family 2 protein [Planctomycetota bacterium]